METVRQPWGTVNIEVPTNRISTILIQRIKRIYRIPLGLTHLLSILVLNVTQNDNILIRSLVKQKGRLCHQGVEPSSCLIHSLRNKLCRELLLKEILIFKWIMMLCKRHCSGIKPAVNNLRNTAHGLAAVRTCKCYGVNIRTMKLYLGILRIATSLRQLCTASDRLLSAAALTLPDI